MVTQYMDLSKSSQHTLKTHKLHHMDLPAGWSLGCLLTGVGLCGGHSQPCVSGEELCQEPPVTVTISTRLETSGVQTLPWRLGKTNRLGSAPLGLLGL